MEEAIFRKYNIKSLEDKVMEIMSAADKGDDKLYGRLGAELIQGINEKIDEIFDAQTPPQE